MMTSNWYLRLRRSEGLEDNQPVSMRGHQNSWGDARRGCKSMASRICAHFHRRVDVRVAISVADGVEVAVARPYVDSAVTTDGWIRERSNLMDDRWPHRKRTSFHGANG